MVRSKFQYVSNKKNKESTGFFHKIKSFFTGSEMRLRISMAILMSAFAICVFSIGFAVCPVAIVLAVAMVYEYDRMFIAPLPSDPNIGGRVPSKESLLYFHKKFAFDAVSIVGLLSLFCFDFLTKRFSAPYSIVYCFGVFSVISFFISLVNKRKHWILESLPVVYIGLGILGLLKIYFSFDWAMVLLFFVITISTDSGAYFVGKMIGGPKLCPRISPKKTWAGFIGGIIFAEIFANLFFYIFDEKSLFAFSFSELAFILILSILAQIGDLFESWLKRTAGVKDSSQLIPGHGGFLDRFDSILFIFDILVLIEVFYFLGWTLN